MKKHFPLFLLVFALVAGGAYAAGELVFVDAQEVFKRFYKTELAQDQIRQQADDIKLEREAMEVEVKELKEEIETLRADSRDETLGEEVRQGKRDKLEERLVELQQKEQEMAEYEKLRIQQLEQQNSRMTKKLFDEIHEAVTIHAREKDYAGVIDRSAQSRTGLNLVLFSNPKRDITTDILAMLNEGHEKPMVEEEPTADTE